MREALTISITERRNGVNSTYRLDFAKKDNFCSVRMLDYIIDRLKRECISLGYKRTTVGKTSSSSKKDG